MKKLPQIKGSWGDLYDLARIGTQSKIFLKAIEWKIFDYLKAVVPAQSVAENMKSHPRNTELFLNALAGMGIINKEKGLFSNTEKTNEFLVSSSPTYLGAFFLHVTSWSKGMEQNIEALVMNGPPEQQGPDMAAGDMWAESARLSAVYQYSGDAQHIVRIVTALPEFPNMKRMLDLGGGAGFFTMAIVVAHPSMQGVVFEQQAVADVAREFVREYEFEDRVSVIDGDFTTDSLGGPYDFIFVSAALNFCKHNMDELFQKIRDALNPGGVFMTHQDGITNERTKPVYHVTEFMAPELMGMDFAIEQGAIAQAMLRAGFSSVRSFTKHSEIGDMDIDIARKSVTS
jgi:predicted O-methyltransferase YrrM